MEPDTDDRHSQRSHCAITARSTARRRVGYTRADSVAFGLVGAALVASALILLMAGESEWPMFALGFGGLLAGRLLGLPGRHLAVIALGLMALGWPIALFSSPIPRATSTLAHLAVAALLAWVLAEPVRHRWLGPLARPWSPRWFMIPGLVLAIGAVWELGEWISDALFETDLAVRPVDTVTDLAADFVGAVVGLALHDQVGGKAPEGTADRSA